MSDFANVVMWGQGLEQQAQRNQDNHAVIQSNLEGAKIHQESATLDLQAKKTELANQEAFKQSVLSQMAKGEDSQNQLATLSNEPTPYQSMHNELSSTADKIKSHVSLVQATQKAIDSFSKTDPSYAMKMQTELNKQIEDGFKLTKAHNDIVSKEAAKVSDELTPVVNADGEPGKVDPELYKEWYARNKADGVPLASMGLTGDPALDDKAIRLIYSKGVAAKDQAMQQSKMLAMKETQWRDQQTNQYHTETLAINRSKEALSREKLKAAQEKTKAVKDPKIAAQKELNRIHNEYMGQYQRLIKERDKATTKDGKEVINERVAKLNNVYEQQKRDTSNSFGIPIVGTPAVKNVAQEAAASGF